MKKFLVTILALAYLTASSGATINLHYCMGKLMSWDLSHKKEGRCGKCGMEKSGHKGCCHDVQKQVKIEKDQKATEASFQFRIIFLDASPVTCTDLPIVYPSSTVQDNPSAHAPPRSGVVPIFILNCDFRI